MSAEAQRRLEEDLRFLESINVWHLVNLRSNPPTNLYPYGDQLDVLNTPQIGMYSQSPYPHHQPPPQQQPTTYSYLSTVGNANQQNNGAVPTTASGYGTALPYPDLIIHTAQVATPRYYPQKISETRSISPLNNNDDKDYEEICDPNKLHSVSEHRDYTPSPILHHNNLTLKDSSRYKYSHVHTNPKEPDDYDAEDNTISNNTGESGASAEDVKKTVKFAPDTIFVERDMNSPFWRAFTERRRQRRINRQRKQLNAQIATASYQPSLVQIVKSAFTNNRSGKDNNGNCTDKRLTKGEVLVYDNSSQIPECYTTQYMYSAPPPPTRRSSKIFQILACQCCSSPS